MENTLNPVDAWHLSLEKSDPKILYDVLDDSFEFFSLIYNNRWDV